ncbi:recombinase family protein [Variovorax ginsengisoli]|uniref:DNA invertase Pin-like site-specific DNA recombinase n=1 Tax=Variovorax ginsengisoli TaxID=363844 RepID=A0ABT9S6S0_9BURK|nr:recombinase family protein [Variovorax ginsengisoli]MDP9900054.1 DNA invertase Pin-like site-specific DNA recombinase [Variovorax ginsengisoli]
MLSDPTPLSQNSSQMKIGYARVSTEEQHLDLQIAALERAGCNKIFTDQGVSGAVFSRPGLDRTLQRIQPGGMLVVWKLDRLGRSLQGLVQLVDALGQRDVQFVSLSEHIDTTSPGGKLFFHMMAALAEFERSLISERTRAGMAEARAQGRPLGRRAALSLQQQQAAHNAVEIDGLSINEVAKRYEIHPRTLRRYIGARVPAAPHVLSDPGPPPHQ